MPISFRCVFVFFISIVWLFPLLEAKASVFVITNMDNVGEGFNDSTPFTPIGGNNATTLGQARLIAFQYAADKIASVLSGDQIITIDTSMSSLGGTTTQATLGGAGAVAYVYDFKGAPEQNVLYPISLANKFFGGDIDPTKADIRARFNGDIDRDDILTGSRWYYGLDAKPENQDIDFVTVVMHELIHGLGFSSTININTGSKTDGRDDVYSRHLYHAGITPPFYASMTDQQRMFANISTNQLKWNGAHTNQQAQQHLVAGVSDNRVQMFAPIQAVDRSSLSHFSTAVTPNEMMEPFYTTANHDLGLAISVLSDIGWGDVSDLAITVTAQMTDPLSFTNPYTITVTNNGPDTAHDVHVSSQLLAGQVTYERDQTGIQCEQNNQGLLCQLGSIANGDQVSYTLTTVRSSLEMRSFKNSITANIVDVVATNNQKTTIIEGVSANATTNNIMIDSSSGGGGGGMMNIFLLMALLSVAFLLVLVRQRHQL